MTHLLHQPVDEWARRTPDREAIRCGEDALTYARLSESSDRLAQVLVRRGVRRGDRVGVYLDKGLDAAVSLYGILKAGAAYVPLDAHAPAARLAYILRDCDIRVLVTDDSKLTVLEEISGDVPGLACLVGTKCAAGTGQDSISWTEVEDAPSGRPAMNAVEKDLSYILYTSGSTGVPKGVVHTHRSALAWAEASTAAFGFTQDDRISNYAPLHFDLSTLDYFSTALAGGTTVVIPELVTKLPASLSDLIARERLTVFYTVPFALTHLALYGALERRDLTALRWVLFGGEPMPPAHLRTLMEMLPDTRFANVYGPTETNGVTYHIVPPLEPDGGGAHVEEPIPIGIPFDNVETVIVDGDEHEVGAGEAGELLIRSATMMRGYWSDEELNNRVFCRRPVFGRMDDEYVRTGDLVRRREDGALEFLGRKDRQIKTRGYRVELDEVEAALSGHPALEAAAVYSVPDDRGSRRIEAAVSLRRVETGGRFVSASDLLEHMRTVLPPYAVPERIRIMKELPQTRTGKIDRNRLEQAASEHEQLIERNA